MKFKIVSRYNEENGKFLGYSIKYQPFSWFPFYWREFIKSENTLYSNIQEVEHDICFMLRIVGSIKETDVFL